MTKRETALALLRQGATLQAIIDATGWTKGTASNWLAAKGSYTIYTLKGDNQ